MPQTSCDLTEDDFIAANRLSSRPTKGRVWLRSAVTLILIGWSGLVLYQAARGEIGDDWLSLFLPLAGWGAWSWIFFQIRVVAPQRWRKLYRQQKSLGEPARAEWSADGIRISRPTAYAEMKWTDFIAWREDGQTLLLFHSDAAASILPKRILNKGDLADLHSHLAAAGVKSR